MKKLNLSLVIFFMLVGACFAEDSCIGTWNSPDKNIIYEFYKNGEFKLINNQDFSVKGTWKKIDYNLISITMQTDTVGMFLELQGRYTFFTPPTTTPPAMIVKGKKYFAILYKKL